MHIYSSSLKHVTHHLQNNVANGRQMRRTYDLLPLSWHLYVTCPSILLYMISIHRNSNIKLITIVQLRERESHGEPATRSLITNATIKCQRHNIS